MSRISDPAPPNLVGARILLVEDDVDLLELLAEQLGRHGAAVTCAKSSMEARGALRDAHYDILVTDLGLPDGTGHELASDARRDGRVRAAIALTGDRDEDTMLASHAMGFVAHITKPCDGDTLARVAEVAAQR